MFALLYMIRPLNVMLGCLAVGITQSIINIPVSNDKLIWLYSVILFFIAGSNILNDIFDHTTDSINHPERSIPSGKISRKLSFFITIIFLSIGIYSAVQLNPLSQWIAFGLVFPLIIFYTPILKSIPLIGNIAISLMLGLVFIYTEVVVSGSLEHSMIPAILAFSLTLIREIVKDIQDVEGDQKVNLATFPVKFGIVPSITISKILMVLLCFLVLFPFVLNIYGILYLLAVVFGVIFPTVYSIFFLQNHPTSNGCKQIAGVLKFSTVFGLISIYLTNYEI